MPDYPLNNIEDIEDFCNRLHKFGKSRTFQPTVVTTNWGKIRSSAQSRWYFRSIARYILPHLTNHPELLSRWIKRGLGNGLSVRFVHELMKLVYLQGGSTTKISTEKAALMMKELRHDFYHDVPSLYIPEPIIKAEAK